LELSRPHPFNDCVRSSEPRRLSGSPQDAHYASFGKYSSYSVSEYSGYVTRRRGKRGDRRMEIAAIPKEARQNPSLLRKRIFDCSSIFATKKNPQCIAEDTSPPSLTLRRGTNGIGPRRSLGEVGCGFSPPRKSNINQTSPFSRRVGFASLP
jgi:hypothetical protein